MFHLPVEILTLIVSYLKIQDAVNLVSACRELHELQPYDKPLKDFIHKCNRVTTDSALIYAIFKNRCDITKRVLDSVNNNIYLKSVAGPFIYFLSNERVDAQIILYEQIVIRLPELAISVGNDLISILRDCIVPKIIKVQKETIIRIFHIFWFHSTLNIYVDETLRDYIYFLPSSIKEELILLAIKSDNLVYNILVKEPRNRDIPNIIKYSAFRIYYKCKFRKIDILPFLSDIPMRNSVVALHYTPDSLVGKMYRLLKVQQDFKCLHCIDNM